MGIGQYYHALAFPKLYENPAYLEEVKDSIVETYNRDLRDGLINVDLATCTIDFAYIDSCALTGDRPSNSRVYVIEVNPFSPDDGVGNNPASLGLFDWNTDDKLIKESEAAEIRIRKEPKPLSDIKQLLSQHVRDFIFGT